MRLQSMPLLKNGQAESGNGAIRPGFYRGQGMDFL